MVTRNGCQKLGDIIDKYTIHVTFDEAKMVMIEALNLNHLVKCEDKKLTCLKFYICDIGINYTSKL